jgi:hypothetical protein
MKVQDFVKTDEFILISKITSKRFCLQEREFIRAIFETSEYYGDLDLIMEIITMLDQCYQGFYKLVNEVCSPKDCNALLLLMKMASPYDLSSEYENGVGWGASAARTYWLKKFGK